MAPLFKTFVDIVSPYRRTQSNQNSVEARRGKTYTAPEQQKLVLAATLNGHDHTITKLGWACDQNGNRQRIRNASGAPLVFPRRARLGCTTKI